MITDVLKHGERIKKTGIVLLDGPGNDIVSTSLMTAAGCQLILFTTGRATPLGAFVPTVKICSNNEIAAKKANWMDYNAGELVTGKNIKTAENELWSLTLSVIEGSVRTKSEINDYREFAIFKNGVTL